ncbi:MAG TPA: glycosyltransferase 87 family protein [Acidobacteriaceae bacterium]
MTQTASVSTPPSAASSSRNFVPLFVGLAIMLGLFLFWTFKIGIPHGLIDRTDFRSTYAAGVLERTHPSQLFSLDAQQQVQTTRISPGQFTLPFFHPAYEALLFVPFSLLPYPAAYAAFAIFNVALIAACMIAGFRVVFVVIPFLQPRPGMLAFFFLPLWLAVLQGQDSILFLLLLILAWNQLDDGDELRAGLLLAAALFKFQIALPLALLLAIRQGGRFVKGFLLGALAVAALSFACSPQAPARFIGLIRGSALAGTRQGGPGYQGYIFPQQMANLRGLFFALFGGHLSARSLMLVTLSASVLLLAFVALRMRRVENDLLAFAAALMACMLTSYHLYPHDLSPLLLPIAAIAVAQRLLKRTLLFVLYLAPLVCFFGLSPDSLYLVSLPVLAAAGAIFFPRPHPSA